MSNGLTEQHQICLSSTWTLVECVQKKKKSWRKCFERVSMARHPTPPSHTHTHTMSYWDSCCSQGYSHTEGLCSNGKHTHTHTQSPCFCLCPHSLEICVVPKFTLSISNSQTGYVLWDRLASYCACSLLIWISALIITAPCFWPRHSPGRAHPSLCNTLYGPRNESKAACQGASVPSFYFCSGKRVCVCVSLSVLTPLSRCWCASEPQHS